MSLFYYAIVFLPFIGCLIVGLWGGRLGARGSEFITCSLVVIAALLSWGAFISVAFSDNDALRISLLPWLASGRLHCDWSLRIDTLTAVMLVVVTTISALVHIYSIGYMHHDASRPRFFAYLSFFTFMMLVLVTSDNMVQLFFGWEGVGLASYLLIGFWYQKPAANAAAIKAFIVNRVGDFAFLLGVFGIFVIFGTVGFDDIFAKMLTGQYADKFYFLHWQFSGQKALDVVCILLFIGAMGKSAQFLLHTWLPDAMEAPTPVSALLHAATMVTAGVFMVARLSPLFEHAPIALLTITAIGAITAFFAASVALVQNDIKRIIAFSTCSQLGYMFVALGIGAYGAAIFHLFTHAFFKALLFQGAGSIIHAVSDEQDIRRMGGLRKYIPATYWLMIIGTLSLTGFGIPGTFFGTAGFFSKDAIIEASYGAGGALAHSAFWLLVIAALFTAFYAWRLIFMVFHGKPRAPVDIMHHVHEAPPVMLVPMVLLAVGALFAGVVFLPYFFGAEYQLFWNGALFVSADNNILQQLHFVPLWVQWAGFAVMAAGFAAALLFYIIAPALPAQAARLLSPLYKFLLNKWYFDELYNFLFVRTAFAAGLFLWKIVDIKIIDGLGPGAIAARVAAVTDRVARLQTGYLYHYAFAMLIGVTAFITWIIFGSLN
ncbi:MAG: NADH-quinone oxidoreductase subunit L [Candidatus Tokpelaia sp.]|uniref:NADH-quinone oxidoreductase subunit L n=1 Tax=Candidatus Tokpelaia sp. TaxID=2233777 RepID=UPI00123933C7|nr:NADH-quinone oxidoreductase subunit L [Candidatus Tokpelaia sp.]KAA6205568.1 MAG: NADH-quinone oxidoreductase subunit L [Candidatus Tokpelaia sp.]KAA6207519.1 MAG: NADH-quinone oxidoreductase subunit L [Candidatus Tokpelaia sp.]KAA6404689.1 NADH-quinone oxidoreductase subunit L [Candidatus Tokpelaia sp.]